MVRTKQTIHVDREMKLTVAVLESGIATLKLSGAMIAELKPGDNLVLVLRPEPPVESQEKPEEESNLGNSGYPRKTNGVGGSGAAALRMVEEKDESRGQKGRSNSRLGGLGRDRTQGL